MFIHLSVSHSVHRGVSDPVHAGIHHSPGQTPPPLADTPEPTPHRADTPRQATPTGDGYCCGRYASYWNAFLLYLTLR